MWESRRVEISRKFFFSTSLIFKSGGQASENGERRTEDRYDLQGYKGHHDFVFSKKKMYFKIQTIEITAPPCWLEDRIYLPLLMCSERAHVGI